MKIIEALKQVKDLKRKLSDLREKVMKHSAYLNYETPVYPDQKDQIDKWIQSHSDILKEIIRLRVAIQRTNLETIVPIELGIKIVKKSIAEWIHRRRDIAVEENSMWKGLTDRGLREGPVKQSTDQIMEVKIVRCFDPIERDKKIDLFSSEPSKIDSKLEVVNALTDLIEK